MNANRLCDDVLAAAEGTLGDSCMRTFTHAFSQLMALVLWIHLVSSGWS
jgi:hypothetical protein